MTTISTGSHSLVAIDPGLNSMGWAYWSPQAVTAMVKKGVVKPPDDCGLIKGPRKLDIAPRALAIAKELDGKLFTWDSDVEQTDFISEFPVWMNIQLGWAAGDLQKLCMLVGVLAGYFHHARSFSVVTPNEWKGQLPKSVVIRRIQKMLGPGATKDFEKDMWDAIGIGYYSLGRF